MKETVTEWTCDDCHKKVVLPDFCAEEYGHTWNGMKLLVTFPNDKCKACARKAVADIVRVMNRDLSP